MNFPFLLHSSKFYFFWPTIKRTLFYKSSGYLEPKASSKFFSSGYFPTEKVTSLKKDTVLYSLEKTKLIRNLTIYGIAQFGICTVLGFNIFISLKDTQPSRNINTQSSKEAWRDVNLGAVKHRIISSLACFSLGFLTAFICYSLPSRIVKTITLCKGGNVASFVTYGPFGKTRRIKVPLQQMSCMMTREQAKSYIPIKIKNRWFYYLIDCKGEFHQPALFDVTVGTRNWKF
ncbi:transmembrane protein 223-like [Argiope bruennichi]|uniref:transmembrane protein 223-like n=1 Tax=Argiope bruennichi TaxID=94029 RepID=UPI0024951F13|nr:transmembrane protein 223-like [Argiope bruennichi]